MTGSSFLAYKEGWPRVRERHKVPVRTMLGSEAVPAYGGDEQFRPPSHIVVYVSIIKELVRWRSL